MKNLRRVLSLALSGIMLVGMMAVGASAVNASDFTDADEITHTEAVNTMAALGIIKGKDNGSFDPAATVTRSEMAKMITVMMNGGVDPVLGVKTTPTFSDIKGHWAEQYIEYCASNKIIGGRGDGTFDPDGQVTGSEAAKMALTALGYDATVYGFVGVDWEINTNTYANLPDANLYDGIRTIDPTAAISRDNVAQMLYKTLDAFTKKMTPTTSTNGTIEWTYTNGATMMEEKFNAVKVEGVVVANEFADITNNNGSALEAGKTEVKVTNYDATPAKGEQNAYSDSRNLTVSVASGEDMLGRAVSVYVKKGTSASKAEILGDMVLSADNMVYTDHSGDRIDDVADDNKLDIVASGDNKTVAMKNYKTAIADTSVDNVAGDLVILVDNDDDGEVEYAFVNTYVLGVVTKKSTKDDGSLTVTSAVGRIEYDDKADVVGFDDVEKDDYVLASEFGGKLYLTKPETVTGDLDAFKSKGDLTVDGTVYKISKVEGIPTGSLALTKAELWSDTNNLGNEAVFYLDANGRIVAVGEVETSGSQYAISWGGAGGNKIDNNRIKLTLEDGTTAVYTINSRSDLKIADAEGETFNDEDSTTTIGTLVAYTMTSSGEVKLSLPDTEDSTDGTKVKFEKGKTMVKVADDKSEAANSSTVFFYVTLVGGNGDDKNDVDKVTVYTGYTNAPSVDSATSGLYALNSKEKVGAAVFVGSQADGVQADHLFLYSWGRTFDGYREANVYLAGSDEHETINVDSGDAGVAADELYTFSVNADGYYELTKVADKADGAYSNAKPYFKAPAEVTAVSRNTIIAGGDEYFFTEAVVIDNIPDEDGDTPGTPDAAIGGAIAEGQKVMMIVDDDDALMIVITEDAPEESGETEKATVAITAPEAIEASGTAPKHGAYTFELKNPDTEIKEGDKFVIIVKCTSVDTDNTTNGEDVTLTYNETDATPVNFKAADSTGVEVEFTAVKDVTAVTAKVVANAG